MHRNENKYDQLFRDRVRDLSLPVRNVLWSRIHSSLRARITSAPRHPFRRLWLLPATSLTAAAAAVLAITLVVLHFTHSAPARLVKTIPAQSTAESSVTPRDSSRDRLSASVASKNIIPSAAVPVTLVPGAPTHAPGAQGVPGTTFTSPNPSPESTATAVNRKDHRAPGNLTTAHHRRRRGATDATAETRRGTQSVTLAAPAIGRHHSNPVTLPSLAGTGTRTTIIAAVPDSKSWHGGSNRLIKSPHFHKTGYVSLYASPDFPSHNYTWSYTAGFRATLQFSPHWSFTAGLEFARVNVPTQVIPPIGYGDTLHSFYFSNYEVPVLFGYTRTFRHSTLTVNGGAILNLYFHQSTGDWVFNLPDRDSYGAVLGVEYSWYLGRRLALFAQPYARYSISDYRMFTQAQRWSSGTLLGIKFQL